MTNGIPIAISHGHTEQLLTARGEFGPADTFRRMEIENAFDQIELFAILF
jgi:hypothetical protein